MKWYTKLDVTKERCPIAFQGNKKNHWFWPKLGVSRLYLQFEFTDGFEVMLKAWLSIEEVPYCFLKSSIKFQGHTGQKNQHFWPELSISGLYLQFKFTNGFEVMLKACRSIGDVPYCFWRSSIKYQGHTGRKISNLNPILSKIARLVAAIKSLRFALFQNTH